MVELMAVMDAVDLPEEWEAFLDPDTGEILVMTDEERGMLEEDELDDDTVLEMPDWEKESVGKLRALLDSGRALRLPDKFAFHEWEVMRRFATSVEDLEGSTELVNAIHGTGAFRMFREATARLGLRDAWLAHRDQALRELAKEWLEENGIAYTDEAQGRG
jgi:hypothetical protein